MIETIGFWFALSLAVLGLHYGLVATACHFLFGYLEDISDNIIRTPEFIEDYFTFNCKTDVLIIISATIGFIWWISMFFVEQEERFLGMSPGEISIKTLSEFSTFLSAPFGYLGVMIVLGFIVHLILKTVFGLIHKVRKLEEKLDT